MLLRRIGHYGHPVLRDRRRPASGPSLAGGLHARRGYANDNHLSQRNAGTSAKRPRLRWSVEELFRRVVSGCTSVMFNARRAH